MNPLTWIGIAVASTIVAAWLAIRAIRWARKGTQGGKVLTAALFPFPDQPPPQELVERQTRLEKDADAGTPRD